MTFMDDVVNSSLRREGPKDFLWPSITLSNTLLEHKTLWGDLVCSPERREGREEMLEVILPLCKRATH